MFSYNFLTISKVKHSLLTSFSNDVMTTTLISSASVVKMHNNITTQKIRFAFLAFHIFPNQRILNMIAFNIQYTVKLLVLFVLRQSKAGFLSCNCNKYTKGVPRIWYKPDNIIVVAKEKSLGVFLGVVNDTNSCHKVHYFLRACIVKVISALVSAIAIDPF